MRGLPGALLGALGKARRPERDPAEQPEPEYAERDGNADFPAQAEKHGKTDREDAAGGFEHPRGDFRIDLRDDAEHPQRKRQHEQAEDDGRHIRDSLACA